jgi:hypothetical protein
MVTLCIGGKASSNIMLRVASSTSASAVLKSPDLRADSISPAPAGQAQ